MLSRCANPENLYKAVQFYVEQHPLEHRWTLWFDNPNGRVNNKTWGQTLRSVYTFGTVEEFWWYVFARNLFRFLLLDVVPLGSLTLPSSRPPLVFMQSL